MQIKYMCVSVSLCVCSCVHAGVLLCVCMCVCAWVRRCECVCLCACVCVSLRLSLCIQLYYSLGHFLDEFQGSRFTSGVLDRKVGVWCNVPPFVFFIVSGICQTFSPLVFS